MSTLTGTETQQPIAICSPDHYRVLAVDDQPELLAALRRLLRSRGFEIEPQTDPHAALKKLEDDPERFDLVVLDINMPTMSGLEFLPRSKEIAPDLPVVMLTGDNRARTAVAALKAGAFNYLIKPLEDLDAVAAMLASAADYCQLQRKNRVLEQRVGVAERFEKLVGSSAPMRQLFATVDKLARSDVNVLIRGESGTGKELVARAIHRRSGRSRGPFVALNCGAIPEALIDSELFGHTKGAFTGAVGSRPGVFAEASGGTLFLDEIGDIPLPVQLRLLRVLEEREVRPVGGSGSRQIDVRVIAATHVDLDEAVERKAFRPDLFYRLNVVSVYLPPLRDRMEDVPLLANHLVSKHTPAGAVPPRLGAATMDVLLGYSWPGNVRELENAIQHALALVPGDEIEANALPPGIAPRGDRTHDPVRPQGQEGDAELLSFASWADELPFNEARKRAQRDFERAYLTRLLARTRGNVSEAARLAGLDRSNFRRVLTRHHIRADDHRPK